MRNLVLPFYENDLYPSNLAPREACGADPPLLGTKTTTSWGASSGHGGSPDGETSRRDAAMVERLAAIGEQIYSRGWTQLVSQNGTVDHDEVPAR
jgi:hypothetical protein